MLNFRTTFPTIVPKSFSNYSKLKFFTGFVATVVGFSRNFSTALNPIKQLKVRLSPNWLPSPLLNLTLRDWQYMAMLKERVNEVKRLSMAT
jgi:hypothetical protein